LIAAEQANPTKKLLLFPLNYLPIAVLAPFLVARLPLQIYKRNFVAF
jgi:hypothetical protein